MEKRTYKDELERLVQIMARLRGKDGCPWDAEQNHESLLKCLIEECYEFYDAVIEKDYNKICDELGDIMLQVVFHSQMAEEANKFRLEDVLKSISDKLERRHPHVFGDVDVKSSDEVVTNWEKIKASESGNEHRKSALDGIPHHMPAILKALKIQKKAAKVGFDWKEATPVIDKVKEELEEVVAEIKSGEKEKLKNEVGDLLFSVVNLARHLDLDPEEALSLTNNKFRKRFLKIEEQVVANKQVFDELTLEELDEYWEQAKSDR